MLGYPRKIMLQQGLLLIISGLIFIFSVDAALSKEFALGGLVAVVPQVLFCLVHMRFPFAEDTALSFSRIYLAEVVKLMFSAVGFMAIFKVVGPEYPVAVFTGFLTVYTIQISGVFFLGQSVFSAGGLEG